MKITEKQLRHIIRNVIKETVDEINLYHGTRADFDKFDVAYLSTGWGQQAYGYGFYLTDCYEAAKNYSCGGKVMEVKVPDGKYLSDKRISPREKQVIARTFFKYYTEELDYGKVAYPDAQARNDFWQYEVSSILNCDDGTYVYGTVASLLGSDEHASNFLHDKCGYVGLKIRDRHSAGKKKPITYVIFNPNDIKILRKNVIKENINNYNTDITLDKVGEKGLGKFGMFKLSPILQSAIYEAAFQLLGFERFAINGEIIFDNSIMDNPWDDAYQVIKWGIDNKGLNPKYLSKVSSQYSNLSDEEFHNYVESVQSGNEFLFTKEELTDIFSHLPHNLQKELIKDIINISRINAVNDTVERLKHIDDGNTLEQFINIMREYLKQNPDKRKIKSLKEPVHQAMISSNMLKA